MAFSFLGFPAPYAFIIAYLIYFVKYETQNIFNFLCFLESALLLAVPAIPYALHNKLIL